MKLTIYGASDDLLEVESDDGSVRDEFDIYEFTEILVTAPDGDALVVGAEFGALARRSGEWTLTVRNTESYPEWPIQFGERPDREGDPAIIIEVPEGTTVRKL